MRNVSAIPWRPPTAGPRRTGGERDSPCSVRASVDQLLLSLARLGIPTDRGARSLGVDHVDGRPAAEGWAAYVSPDGGPMPLLLVTVVWLPVLKPLWLVTLIVGSNSTPSAPTNL